jgi:haloacetate dehalogenase
MSGEPTRSNALPDLFPGFEAGTALVNGVEIFYRTGGAGPPMLLLHGYPQSHAMWHRIAPQLAEHFTLVIPDLRGYGQSSAPEDDAAHTTYSKRVMAADMTALMASLGHDRFHLVGHDRGARVAYRLALDTPDAVERLAVLDIVPTHAMWTDFTVGLAMATYHWLFLAQPHPLPETLIAASPDYYIDATIASWAKHQDLSAFDPSALDHYRAAFRQAERIHAMCADYRAGQTTDFVLDSADVAAGRKITCPLLAVWGQTGIPSKMGIDDKTVEDDPLTVWKPWGTDVTGRGIDSGHFVAEENPDATLEALLAHFAKKPT